MFLNGFLLELKNQHRGSQEKRNIPDPGSESASKNLSIFNQKAVSKLSEKQSRMFIPDQDPDCFSIPDPGSKGQKSIGSQIRNNEFMRVNG